MLLKKNIHLWGRGKERIQKGKWPVDRQKNIPSPSARAIFSRELKKGRRKYPLPCPIKKKKGRPTSKKTKKPSLPDRGKTLKGGGGLRRCDQKKKGAHPQRKTAGTVELRKKKATSWQGKKAIGLGRKGGAGGRKNADRYIYD